MIFDTVFSPRPCIDTDPGSDQEPIYAMVHKDGEDIPTCTGYKDVQFEYDSANTGKNPKDLIRNAQYSGANVGLQPGSPDQDLTDMPTDPVAMRQAASALKEAEDLFAAQPIDVRRACDFDLFKFLDFVQNSQQPAAVASQSEVKSDAE